MFDMKYIDEQIDKVKEVDQMIQFYKTELERKFNMEFYTTIMGLLREYTELKDELNKLVYDTRKLGFKKHCEIDKLVRARLIH